MSLLNEDQMTPFERLKTAYKIYDKKQKRLIANLNETVEMLKAKIEEMTSKMQEKDEQIAELSEMMKDDNCFRLLNAQRVKYEAMKQQCRNLEKKLMAAKMDHISDDVLAMNAQLETFRAENKKLRAADRNHRETIDQLITKVSLLQIKIDCYEKEKSNI